MKCFRTKIKNLVVTLRIFLSINGSDMQLSIILGEQLKLGGHFVYKLSTYTCET